MPGPKYTLNRTGEEVAEAIEKAIALEAKKLETTTITGVSGSTTASLAKKGTAVNVATTGTPVTVATGLNGTAYSASYDEEEECLNFSAVGVTTATITPATANGTITPYTFTEVTVPKAATSATTVATGQTSTSGTGDAIVSGDTI
jgi:hypothetical protein